MLSFYMSKLHNRLLQLVESYLLVISVDSPTLLVCAHTPVGPTTVQANKKLMFYIEWLVFQNCVSGNS